MEEHTSWCSVSGDDERRLCTCGAVFRALLAAPHGNGTRSGWMPHRAWLLLEEQRAEGETAAHRF